MGQNENRARAMKDDIIISCLRNSQLAALTRREIHKQLIAGVGADAGWSKKDLKHALKCLVKRGFITKGGKDYSLISRSEGGNEATVADEDGGDASNTLNYVPIAQRMRKTSQHVDDAGVRGGKSSSMDLDEEIRRLEEELAADTANSDTEHEEYSDDEDGGDDNDNDDERNEDGAESRKMGSQNCGIICLSNLANDRIEPLPQHALPQNKRRKLKGVDSATCSKVATGSNEPKKRKRPDSSDQNEQEHVVSDGLRHAVQELLQNYVRPSQLDRPPFYCRICQHQSKSQSDFDHHRASEFHKVAVIEEKKSTYCKLCRKQLTSVIQMEEHLKSRPHRDRMAFVKGKQQGSIGSIRGGRGGGGFQSRGGCAKSDPGGRQWC
jgi:hypothetical protein